MERACRCGAGDDCLCWVDPELDEIKRRLAQSKPNESRVVAEYKLVVRASHENVAQRWDELDTFLDRYAVGALEAAAEFLRNRDVSLLGSMGVTVEVVEPGDA